MYAAEIAAFEGTSFESLATFDALIELARVIDCASWWPAGRVDVRAARVDARSSSTTASSRGVVVRLAPPQMTPATLIHELAHVLVGVGAGHGSRFRRAHVDLARVAFGTRPGDWLSTAYLDVGLDLGPRAWALPSAADEAIAL